MFSPCMVLYNVPYGDIILSHTVPNVVGRCTNTPTHSNMPNCVSVAICNEYHRVWVVVLSKKQKKHIKEKP